MSRKRNIYLVLEALDLPRFRVVFKRWARFSRSPAFSTSFLMPCSLKVLMPFLRSLEPSVSLLMPFTRDGICVFREDRPLFREVAPSVRVLAPELNLSAPSARVLVPATRLEAPELNLVAPEEAEDTPEV